MPTYYTHSRHGYSVRFSKFSSDRVVVASSQFFGLTGAGTLHILDVKDDDIKETKAFQWSDGLFDVVSNLIATQKFL